MDASYAEQVINDAMRSPSGGLDPREALEAVEHLVRAIRKHAAVLEAAAYQPGENAKIARSVNHAMNAADGVYRLL